MPSGSVSPRPHQRDHGVDRRRCRLDKAGRKPQAKADYEEALIEAREEIAALGLMDNVGLYFDAEATKLSSNWLKQYGDVVKKLPDDRQETYRQISAMSREPHDVDLARPLSRMEATMVREKDGTETKLPSYPHHSCFH